MDDSKSNMEELHVPMNENDDDDIDDLDIKTEFKKNIGKTVIYSVDNSPPWHLCIILGFQHYLTAVGGIISIPMILSEYFCMDKDVLGISELMGTFLFVSGMATLLQTTFGVRLPIVQGSTPTFLVPTIAILLQPQWTCPYTEARIQYGQSVNFTNLGLPEVGSSGHRDIWKARILEIQGAIIIASFVQIFIGLSGIMNFALKYIGPLSIVPVIVLTGLSLFPAGLKLASGQWWIALLTMCLVLLFSQYMDTARIASARTSYLKQRIFTFFNMFPVLFAIVGSCIVCTILTLTDVLPNIPDQWGYMARIDRNVYVMHESNWFRFPYPGQWGTPTVSVASVLGMVAGVVAAMLESIGDYYACARLSGAPSPPMHAINRGVFIEGICCVLAGAWGSGNGTTSFSENIGVIGITKVGSRRVVQVGGCLMLVLGCLGKFSALFTLIPEPIYGGMFVVSFGMVAAVGLSNLQYVDLNSSRNLCIIGVALFIGQSVPTWIHQNDAIKTGSEICDQIFSVLLGTSMFVGGATGFILDNTIPGSEHERGVTAWRTSGSSFKKHGNIQDGDIYDPPFYRRFYSKTLSKFCPVLP
ncbi:hypothetical protein ACF0H5_007937 [Mactra antiquata]